ncbi:MAG: chloride channel protein, partial [Polyangiales bacterium]
MNEQGPESGMVPRTPIPRPRFFVAVVLVAVGAAAFAIAFRSAISLVFAHAYRARDVLDAFRALPWPLRIALPAIGGALAALASARGRGQGVGEVMEAIAAGGKMSLGATSWKALGSWLAIVSGGSIGREGPLIQFGGALGARVGDSFGIHEARKRSLIAAGTAAGFAAAYNTPIAAVLFVTEIVTGVVALHVMVPTIVAAVLATVVTRAAVGAGPLYGQHAFVLRSNGELAIHALLGVASGVVAVFFMRILSTAERHFARVPNRPLRAAIGGGFVGLLACAWPEVTGNGYEAIAGVLGGLYSLAFIAILLVAKPIATASSVGSGSPGGVFTPSLFIGAALGACVGGLFAHVLPGRVAPVGAYALVGMAAVVAATTHAPVMAAVLVFELSGDYAIVLPLLIATSLSTG